MAIKKQINQAKSDSAAAHPVKIFDVAKPGVLTPATATARPVIITNRAVMQDPMMVAKPQSDLADKDPTARAQNMSPKMVIKPFSGRAQDTDTDGVLEPGETAIIHPAAEPSEDSKVTESSADTPATESDRQPAVAETGKTQEDLAAHSDAAATPSTADSTAASSDEPTEVDLNEDTAKMEAEAKAQDELDTLVEQKKYFLPINAISLRRSKHVSIFGVLLIILLAVVWLDIAMDAGFITVPGLHALTHLFHN